MTRLALVPVLLVTAACGVDGEDITDQLLAEYSARVAEIDAATTAYKAAVDGATDLGEVGSAIDTYEAAADAAIEELEHVMEDFHDCEMMGDSESRVSLANATITAMHDAVDAIATAHESHDDVADCKTTAADHTTAMTDHMGDLSGHGTAWQDNMTCMGHEGAEEEEH